MVDQLPQTGHSKYAASLTAVNCVFENNSNPNLLNQGQGAGIYHNADGGYNISKLRLPRQQHQRRRRGRLSQMGFGYNGYMANCLFRVGNRRRWSSRARISKGFGFAQIVNCTFAGNFGDGRALALIMSPAKLRTAFSMPAIDSADSGSGQDHGFGAANSTIAIDTASSSKL